MDHNSWWAILLMGVLFATMVVLEWFAPELDLEHFGEDIDD